MLVGAGSDVAVTSDMENRDTQWTSPSLQVCSTCMAALQIIPDPYLGLLPRFRVMPLVWLQFPQNMNIDCK